MHSFARSPLCVHLQAGVLRVLQARDTPARLAGFACLKSQGCCSAACFLKQPRHIHEIT